MHTNSVSASLQLARQPCKISRGSGKAPRFLSRNWCEKKLGRTNDRLRVLNDVAFLADAVTGVSNFEPRFNPAVGVAAVVAAIPPILFWVRVYNNIQRVEREKKEEEEARQSRIKRLFGDD